MNSRDELVETTLEWQEMYFSYEVMSKTLEKGMDSKLKGLCDDDSRTNETDFLRDFLFVTCDFELRKTKLFFCDRFEQANSSLTSLKSKATDLQKLFCYRSSHGLTRKEELGWRSLRVIDCYKASLALAVAEFHLSLELLRRFQLRNLQSVQQIVAHHDRMAVSELGKTWFEDHVQKTWLYTKQSDLVSIIGETKTLYSDCFTGGDQAAADAALHVPSKRERLERSYCSLFYIGVFLGAGLMLCIATVITGIWASTFPHFDIQLMLQLFRAVFLVCVYTLLCAVNLLMWNESPVNRVLLFEQDPRNYASHLELFQVAGSMLVLWLCALLVYFVGDGVGWSPCASPLALTVVCLLYLVNPLPLFHHRSRRWLLRLMWRVFTAPFQRVRFIDVWFADQLTSLVTVFVDLEFLICYCAADVNWIGTRRAPVCSSMLYGLRPLVAVLPAWFRCAQCLRCYRDTRRAFPHLLNAGKYSTSFFVVLFSSMHTTFKSVPAPTRTDTVMFALWILASLFSSVYTFIWDTTMDWRLLDGNTGPSWLLRRDTLYQRKAVYYWAVVQNLLLRFTWTLTMSVGEWGVFYAEMVRTVVAILELFRRFVWNFFRLEVEQLSNRERLRATRDVTAELPERGRQLLRRIDKLSLKRTKYGTLGLSFDA